MFEAFPKIPRLRRECTITEKIDGTNAQVCIEQVAPEVMEADHPSDLHEPGWLYVPSAGVRMRAGSRTRYIVPGDDNFGFAAWVHKNADELTGLGPGRHFGEWYGAGIQRRYGLPEKWFALFNATRWADGASHYVEGRIVARPSCCHVVPVLYEGTFNDLAVTEALHQLREYGSRAAPGFMQPEGIIVYMHASKTMHKVTLEHDEAPKGQK
jgi:hypothetical protein